MRSMSSWEDILKDKTPYQAAYFIISDLVGYRKTSLNRTDDVDSLTNAIVVIRRMVSDV